MTQHIFKTVIFLMAAAASVAIHAQTSTQNYVKTETFINGNGGKVTTVQYCDGLGRPVLTATDGTGSNGSFVYTRQHYDYGQRVASQTIPAYGTSSPDFLTDAQLSWKYADTHRSTTFQYDALDRVITEKGPGDEWHASNRFRHTAYQLNGAGEVKLYRVSSNTLQQSGYYPAGRLYVEEYTDEDQNATRIYKDMQGRTVMQRQGSDSDTYYVYDAAGNLRYVLPPAASAGLSGGSWTMASSAILQQFAYYYEYDSRARCTRKQLPGCDYVTMTYDTNDRLVTSQDGNQRPSNVSTYYEYDNLGRQTVMGVDTAGVRTPLLETFYDDYTFLTSEESAKVGFNASGGYHSSYASARGLQTGSRVHHLEKTSLYEVTAMYYDALGNMIQSRSTNHLSGNDDVYIQYNEYTGAELQRRHVHSASGKPTRTEVCTNTYDYAGRLQSVSHKLGDNAPVTISSLTYDEYGRLASKTVGDNVQTVSYSYNIRDWATSISSTHFSEQLAYTGTNGAASAATPRFNGNIAAMAWRAGTETAYRNYQFSYNVKGWMTAAAYSGTGSYNTQYQYDTMGNITSLQRYGLQDNSQYGLIDNLSYTYNGNQLVTVTDAVSGPNYSGAFHFSDGSDEDVEYEYDQNGNLTKDLNKKITQIKYNLLNLPSSITYQNGNMASYVYSAAGGKLSVSYHTGTGNTSTQYCGNIIYDNNNLSQVLIDGGYITFSGTTPQYHYYLQDHLGNNRVVVKQDGTIEQVTHYYPFGGLFGESTDGDVQRFKYNGKELERMHGLDWYDYGARHMDAALGRWSTIDPMAEKYYNMSPYNYCGNNPIKFIDPNGCSTWVKDNGEGKFEVIGGDINDKDLNIYVYTQDDNGEYTIRGESIGISATITSFYDSDDNGGRWQNGSVIDVNDLSGNEFLSNIENNTPPLFDDYMINARNRRQYDFKETNGKKNGSGYKHYRGMPVGVAKNGQIVFASGRDVGNIAAGYVAAVNNMSWPESRVAFDTYQSYTSGKLSREGASTRNAEFLGWVMGIKNTNILQRQFELLKSIIHPVTSFIF